ncbi:MAG: hypothetical protein AAGH99_03855 [Planctomycetota bacterium]
MSRTKHHTAARRAALTGAAFACALAFAFSPGASAQDAGRPVDLTVAGQGPQSVSLRRTDPGNAQFSFRYRLTVADFNANWSPSAASPTAVDPSTGLAHSQGFQYRSPGVRALIDRPEFARLSNGSRIMTIPANTVFQLTHETPTAAQPTPPAVHQNFVDRRLNLRLSEPNAAASLGGDGTDPRQRPAGPSATSPRLERVSASDMRPIPTPAQMRFPQAAFPYASSEPAAGNVVTEEAEAEPTSDASGTDEEPMPESQDSADVEPAAAD